MTAKSRGGRGGFRKGSPDQHNGGIPPVVMAMRAEPGEWFIVEEGAPKAMVNLGMNYRWLKNRPGFEIKPVDGVPDNPIAAAMGLVTIYARWVGTDDDAVPAGMACPWCGHLETAETPPT